MKKNIIIALLSITLLSNAVCSCGHIHSDQCANKENCHECIQPKDRYNNEG